MNKTKLFVARDKAFGNCEKGKLYLFANKPYRYNNGMGMEYWKCDVNSTISLDEDTFPNLKWEDEPIEVELNEFGLPSVNQIVNVLTCIEDYQQKVFRYGVQREEIRIEQAKEIQEYIRKYYNYWIQ